MPGGAVILTGVHSGAVDVTVRLVPAPPPADAAGWDAVEEVELVSFTGEMRLGGLMGDVPETLPALTPHGPGRYGMRVQAHGRDIAPTAVPKVPFEFYLVTVWPLEVGAVAVARLGPGVEAGAGIGVAGESGLSDEPDSGAELRRWAREHGLPQSERGRAANHPRGEPPA
ncbi:hypothetical protein HII36_49220 [Nonomuraea sp. NN258]|uniref:hypothetical protein n=1 Tax=Nonomuraea antri TaxID=2730852 RepID=UPI0015692CE3|nr:hypothetical protein [Nonomuraea antri]NRQ39761.1 hypothetical protein [Nonomuraea antri]